MNEYVHSTHGEAVAEVDIASQTILKRAEAARTIYGGYEDESGRQEIPIGWISADSSKKTIIAPVAWSDYPYRRFNVLRQAALAEAVDAEVFIVGFPGMGPETDPLTPKQEEQLSHKEKPSFSRVGQASWDALDSAIKEVHPETDPEKYLAGRRVTLLGYSQGSSHIAGMLDSLPESVTPESIHFIEMADGVRERSVTRLIGGFMIDGTLAHRYFKENGQNYPGIAETHKAPDLVELSKRVLGEAALRITPLAMARGTVGRDLKNAYQESALESGLTYVLQRGERSAIANEETYRALGALIRVQAHGEVEPDIINKSDNHSFQESLARYGAIATTLPR